MERIRDSPYWRDVLVFCSEATPEEFLATLDETAIPYLVTGVDHVDLGAPWTPSPAGTARRSSSTVAVRSAAHYSGPAWSTR